MVDIHIISHIFLRVVTQKPSLEIDNRYLDDSMLIRHGQAHRLQGDIEGVK